MYSTGADIDAKMSLIQDSDSDEDDDKKVCCFSRNVIIYEVNVNDIKVEKKSTLAWPKTLKTNCVHSIYKWD